MYDKNPLHQRIMEELMCQQGAQEAGKKYAIKGEEQWGSTSKVQRYGIIEPTNHIICAIPFYITDYFRPVRED